jgi:hypothetical protein
VSPRLPVRAPLVGAGGCSRRYRAFPDKQAEIRGRLSVGVDLFEDETVESHRYASVRDQPVNSPRVKTGFAEHVCSRRTHVSFSQGVPGN